MRNLVTIQKIEEIQPIELADAIEKAKIKEWWVVVKKGEFRIGDLCMYFEIDSFLPVKPEYEFLLRGSNPKKMLVDGQEKNGIRLKTIRLRGQISQGLALPITDPFKDLAIGEDITEQLGVLKYEVPVPANLAGVVKGNFPSFIPKSDEERLQNCADLLVHQKGSVVYIASKLDGTSATYFRHKGEFGACSRNLELKESSGNTIWEMADKYDLKTCIPEGFAVQGELVGEGINKNPLRIKGHKLFVFNVFDITGHRYLDFDEMMSFCREKNLDIVPIIKLSVLLDYTFEQLMELADQKSPLNPDVIQEGIVVRPINERNVLINGVVRRFSFKVISNDYLLKMEQ
ncbi:RNA ligase (ATP) [Candidatus Woesearchaeota archaeon]|nr:RNA ligase (ATP) [Candidatus Woesearchaeota archaeon]